MIAYAFIMSALVAVNIGVGTYILVEGRAVGCMNIAAAAFLFTLALVTVIADG